MQEIWKPIPGYEGLYDASSIGRIRTSPMKTTSNARYPVRVWKSRILKPKGPRNIRRQDGRVSLWKDGEHKDLLVARLVAMAWIGLPEDGMTVNHINGDWEDNRPENLEWVSLAENIQKGFDIGLYQTNEKSVFLVDEDGKEELFKSMESAGRAIGRGKGYISGRLQAGKHTAFAKDGRKYQIQTPDRRKNGKNED